MDISTGLGLGFGCIVLVPLIMLGGDLKMFVDLHAFIVIGGGHATGATLIRFPLSGSSWPAARHEVCVHDAPLDAPRTGRMRSRAGRDRPHEGPLGLEKEDIEDPFLAKGMRYVADGYDAAFIRESLELDRGQFFDSP